jgi:hypothetical protein
VVVPDVGRVFFGWLCGWEPKKHPTNERSEACSEGVHVDLGERDVQDCACEKEDRKTNGCVKEAFFDPAFCSEYIAFAAKCASETGSALLEENGCCKQNCQKNLDKGK